MIGILIFTITALILGTLLVLTDNHFKKEDDKIEQNLPGYNCGVCGFGSCAGMKEAILENPENYKKCKLLKNQEAIKYFESLKNKGFTLVELLAVVIILGILAVVIVPKIQQTLKDSKRNTYEASVRALDREADVFYSNQKISQTQFNGCEYNFTTNNNTCTGFEFKGQKPESGGIVISKDGKSAFGLKFDDYCYSKGYNDETIEIIETENCAIPKEIGDIITINGENFYVTNSNASETKLLAMYNINVGPNKDTNLPENKQHESLTGNNNSYGRVEVDDTYSTLQVNNDCPSDDGSSYLKPKYGSTYPIYFYDEDSNLYQYLESYKSILSNVKEIKLPSYEDVSKLGCNETKCDTTYPWVYSSRYWLGTAYNYASIYIIGNDIISKFGNERECDYIPEIHYNNLPGLRPLIIVDTKNI